MCKIKEILLFILILQLLMSILIRSYSLLLKDNNKKQLFNNIMRFRSSNNIFSSNKNFNDIDEKDIVETFTRGGGPGGQSINKTMNRVNLVHVPTGITVSCQDFRDLTTNRKHARTILKEKIDFLKNGNNSKIGKRIDKIRKRKSKAKQRTNAKKKELNSDNNSTISSKSNSNQINDESIDQYDDSLYEYLDDDDTDDLTEEQIDNNTNCVNNL